MSGIEEVELKNWKEFEREIEKDRIKYDKLKKATPHHISDLLFRGHSKKEWKLTTTLERFFRDKNCDHQEYSIKYYHWLLKVVKPAISSLTSAKYELPELDESQDFEISIFFKPPPGYELMVYLRHHGFPSPLLDWTVSPYVAAFFAFSEVRECDDTAIYSYREYIGEAKGGWVKAPRIHGLGPYIHTHKRHYTQQCQYTICTKPNENNNGRIYCPHEDVEFGNDQDALKKYIIPGKERKKVLEKLDLMNINAFSLFGSEESLMSTLAYREIEKGVR